LLDLHTAADVLEDVNRRLVVSLGLRGVAISISGSVRHTWPIGLQSLRRRAY